MKHLKYFNESLINKTEEEYKSIIENCILYLIDSYQYEYFRTDDDKKPLYSYFFNINYGDDINELCDLIDSSYHKLIDELNPTINFSLTIFDRDDSMIYGTEVIDYNMVKDIILTSKKFQLHYGAPTLQLTLIIS